MLINVHVMFNSKKTETILSSCLLAKSDKHKLCPASKQSLPLQSTSKCNKLPSLQNLLKIKPKNESVTCPKWQLNYYWHYHGHSVIMHTHVTVICTPVTMSYNIHICHHVVLV